MVFVHCCVPLYTWASIPKLFSNLSSILARSEQIEQLLLFARVLIWVFRLIRTSDPVIRLCFRVEELL